MAKYTLIEAKRCPDDKSEVLLTVQKTPSWFASTVFGRKTQKIAI
ncbi:hypothetical protein LCGC14_1988850 [marine sediment metagenome]|uniref:Uncharacterized protein n=1 Tax=marine sediment metagenome TaxID=412755 RepID=A0A0F9FUQ6_9ZZZZ